MAARAATAPGPAPGPGPAPAIAARAPLPDAAAACTRAARALADALEAEHRALLENSLDDLIAATAAKRAALETLEDARRRLSSAETAAALGDLAAGVAGANRRNGRLLEVRRAQMQRALSLLGTPVQYGRNGQPAHATGSRNLGST